MDSARLGDICNVVSGGTPARSKTEFWQDGDIPWIKIGNIKGKYVTEADEFVTKRGLEYSSAKMLAKGTILYTIFATLGEVGILNFEACTNQAIAGITVKDQSKVSVDYLYYFLKSKKRQVNAVGRGVAQNNINLSILRSIDVPLPDMGEQRKIVDILDKVMSVIEQRKRQLDAFDKLVKARFVEMFGDPEFNTKVWPMCSLGSVCKVGSSKRIYQNEQSQDGVPFWRISDLVNKMDTGVADSGLFIPEEKYKELKEARLVPVTGDILVTSRGTLGRCYIVKDEDCFYFQDGMISWLSDYVEDVTPLYLQFLFTMPGFRKQIDSTQTGSTVSYLSIAMLKKLQIMMPSKDVQESFETFVAKVDKSKVAVQKSLDEAQLLFDSLMQKYFG